MTQDHQSHVLYQERLQCLNEFWLLRSLFQIEREVLPADCTHSDLIAKR